MQKIELRPAGPGDRLQIFEALARSDLTDVLLGHPSLNHTPLLSYEDFCADYRDHYFDGSEPTLGRCFVIERHDEAIGQVNYNHIDPFTRTTELDIWMYGSQHCGHGYGTQALQLLCRYLQAELGVRSVFVQPSASNRRAIRSYEKAGFREATGHERAAVERLSTPDTPDPYYLIQHL